MSVETTVISALLASSALTTIVESRIYTEIPDQGADRPFVLVTRTATETINTIHDGVPAASKAEMHISAWAERSLQAEAIADAVIIALRDFATTTNRFAHYDESMDANAVVTAFDIWDVETT